MYSIEDRSQVITIGGVEHKLILTTKATKDITKRYGGLEKLGDKLLKNATMEESLGEVIWLIALLANQEILIHNLQHRDEPKPLLTEDEIELLTNPYELAEYKDAIMAAMFANRHVEEETLIKAYLMAWNALVENRADFMEQWTEQLQSENLLEGYRAEKFIEYTDGAETLTEMDTDFMLKTLDHIKVFEDGTLLVVFLDGTEIECKNEEE
jgi:hypothetical protein